jgi:hypothetical protein
MAYVNRTSVSYNTIRQHDTTDLMATMRSIFARAHDACNHGKLLTLQLTKCCYDPYNYMHNLTTIKMET